MNLKHTTLDEGALSHKKQVTELYNPKEVSAEWISGFQGFNEEHGNGENSSYVQSSSWFLGTENTITLDAVMAAQSTNTNN